MTTPTQPADLLAPLLALVAKWDKSVDVAEDQRDKDGLSMNHAAAAYHDGLATAYRRCHDELMESLAAHRGEASGAVPLVQSTAPERIWLAVAEEAYYADQPFPDGVEEICWSHDAPLEVCVPYVRADLAHPPQAQAGAGDAFLADTWEGLGYTKFNGDRFVMFQRSSDGLQLYCRQEFHEQAALALAALEASQ